MFTPRTLHSGVRVRIENELRKIYDASYRIASIQKLPGCRYVIDSSVGHRMVKCFRDGNPSLDHIWEQPKPLINRIAESLEEILDCKVYTLGGRFLLIMNSDGAALSFELTYDNEWRKQHA